MAKKCLNNENVEENVSSKRTNPRYVDRCGNEIVVMKL